MAREMAMAEAADDAASAKEDKAKKEAAHASVFRLFRTTH
jgi:hypothetical protein